MLKIVIVICILVLIAIVGSFAAEFQCPSFKITIDRGAGSFDPLIAHMIQKLFFIL